MRSPSGVEVAERLPISARSSLGDGKFTRKRGPNVQGTLCAPELRLEQELANPAEYACSGARVEAVTLCVRGLTLTAASWTDSGPPTRLG